MQGLKDLADTELLAESANTELQVNKQKNMDFLGKYYLQNLLFLRQT